LSHNDTGLLEALARGYAEMSEINASLAAEGFYADSEAFENCEENLTECE
jgi:hypothetical protein